MSTSKLGNPIYTKLSEPQSHHWVATPLCVAKVNILILWRKFTQLNLTSKHGLYRLYTSLFEQQTPPNEVIHESWNTHHQLKSKYELFWTSEPGHKSCTEKVSLSTETLYLVTYWHWRNCFALLKLNSRSALLLFTPWSGI